MIHLAKRSRRYNVPMVVRPTENTPVERTNQLQLGRCRVRTQDAANLRQERVRVLTRWRDQELSTIASNMLAKKIKPLIITAIGVRLSLLDI